MNTHKISYYNDDYFWLEKMFYAMGAYSYSTHKKYGHDFLKAGAGLYANQKMRFNLVAKTAH